MGKIGVATDSHSSITLEEANRLGIKMLAMPFCFGEEEFFENENLTREEFFRRLSAGEKVTTSQPAMASVTGLWDEALKEYDQIIYIPISSGLSGSCMTAVSLAQDKKYRDRVFVVDNGRVSTPLHRSVLDALEMIEAGMSAEDIKNKLEEYREKMVIYVAVEDLEYLKRGGRINSTSAAMGNILNIKPVLRFDVGTLDAHKKCRGFKKARQEMIAALKEDLNTRFKEWYDRDEVYILAASSADENVTAEWLEEIKEAFPGKEVMCDNLSMGVSCHIGPGGLGIGCSCKPNF